MLIKSLKKFTLINYFIAAISLLVSCSSTKDMSKNQKQSGHNQLYTYPQKLESSKEDRNDKRFKRIVFLSINDLNGKIEPNELDLNKDSTDKKRTLKVGGINGLKTYIDIFRQEYPDQVALVDSGSFLNKEQNHKQTIFFLNYLGIDIANLGENEFDLKTRWKNYPSYLDHLFKKANFKTVNTNLYNLNNGSEAKFKFTNPTFTKLINGVKVSFIGLHSQETAKENSLKKLNGFYFQNMAKTIIEDANYLRKKGSQVIVLLVHNGIDCTSMLSNNLGISPLKVNFNSSDISVCESVENELVKTLSLLPPQMVDLVITSGKKSKVANNFYNFPVMQNFGEGQFISWANLYYDSKLHRIDTEKTKVFQPVQICHQFIEDSEDCFIEKSDLDKDIVPATFLGQKVKINSIPKF